MVQIMTPAPGKSAEAPATRCKRCRIDYWLSLLFVIVVSLLFVIVVDEYFCNIVVLKVVPRNFCDLVS